MHNTLSVFIASTNPNKIQGVKQAFSDFLQIKGVKNISLKFHNAKIPSNVSDQSLGLKETYTGAYNRAVNSKLYCKQHQINIDFFIGLESGILHIHKKPHIITIACALHKDGRYYFGSSIIHPLPQQVDEYILQGKELAEFAAKLSKIEDIRSKQGIIGYLTNNNMTRAQVNYLATKGALIGFIKEEVFT